MSTILLAEDNAVNRELMREVLQTWGYEVLEAVDGEEAMQKLSDFAPDVVLLDVRLPKRDGYEVLRAIRNDERLKTLPVIAVTAFAMMGSREEGLQAGFDAYVTKPVSLALLQSLLKQYSPS